MRLARSMTPAMAAIGLLASCQAEPAYALPVPLNLTGQVSAPQGADIIPILPSPFTGSLQYVTVAHLLSGAAGSPGGSLGQIEWNSGGAFGGFTVGGDGTLVPATGVLTVTKTAGVAFGAFATSTNAANLTGTAPASVLPPPSATTLGGIESLASAANKWINQISTAGVPSATRPACANLSDAVSTCNSLASPAFTGTPTAPTPTAGDNSTALATTAFVIAAVAGASAAPAIPQGRLTLQSGAPVQTADQTARSTIYYDCYAGNAVPYWTGSAVASDAIASCEVGLTMVGTNLATGEVSAGGVYDLYWVHAHAGICIVTNAGATTNGSGWDHDTGGSNTARGTGYSQVHQTKGFWTNVNAIAHCYNGGTDWGAIGADQGSYLGSVYTTAAGQTAMTIKPAATGGGTGNVLGLWNAYNRLPLIAVERDTQTGVTPSPFSTWDPFGGGNRITYVDGLAQATVEAEFSLTINPSANSIGYIGVDFDSTSATPATGALFYPNTSSAGYYSTVTSDDGFFPSIGLHYLQAMVYYVGTGQVLAAGASGQVGQLTVKLAM